MPNSKEILLEQEAEILFHGEITGTNSLFVSVFLSYICMHLFTQYKQA